MSTPSTLAGSPLRLLCSNVYVLTANQTNLTITTPLVAPSLSIGNIVCTSNLGVDTINANALSLNTLTTCAVANVSQLYSANVNVSNTIQGNVLTASYLTPPSGYAANNVSGTTIALAGDGGEATFKLCGLGNAFNIRMGVSSSTQTAIDTANTYYNVALLSTGSAGTFSGVSQSGALYPTLATGCLGNLSTHCVMVRYNRQIAAVGSSGTLFDVVLNGSSSSSGVYRNFGTVVYASVSPVTYLRLTVENSNANAYVMASCQPRNFF